MKRTSVFIFAISFFSAGIFLSWLFFKYFQDDKPSVLTFPVTLGNIIETVKIRGEAVSQKEFDLGFVSGGTVSAIFVEEGEIVKEGSPLIKLDTTSYELEVKKLSAVLSQKESGLEKLISGYTTEDITVTKTKVTNAEQSLSDKNQILKDYLNDSYTKTNNAIGVYVDQFFDNPRTSSVQLNISISNVQLENTLENERLNIGVNFVTWQNLLTGLTDENLKENAEKVSAYSSKIRDFLDQMAVAVNALSPSSILTSTTISTYRSDISSARTAVNTAITNLTTALEGVRDAESALALAESEFELKTAGPRIEDADTARAQIVEAESDLASARDKIRKATLTAPVDAKVMKISVKRGETLTAGESAIILATSQNKIQADVSELDIVKIPEEGGAETSIKFDAFPALTFSGKVVSIEPKEIVKDGDTYYRVNFYFDAGTTPIRSGMSSDLEVKIAEKTGIFIIPDYAIYQRDGKDFVKIDDDGKEIEVAVTTGISNGESTEIIDGLSEGQIVIVSSS